MLGRPHEEKVIQSVLSRDYTLLYTLLLQYLPLILPLFLSPSPYLRPKTRVLKSKYGWINIDPSTGFPSRNHHPAVSLCRGSAVEVAVSLEVSLEAATVEAAETATGPSTTCTTGTGAPGSLSISFPHRDPRLRFWKQLLGPLRLCLEINKSSKQKAETNQFGELRWQLKFFMLYTEIH